MALSNFISLLVLKDPILFQQIGGDATLLFYGTEEGSEGKNAYLERRKPDFSRFPRLPWSMLISYLSWEK